jgi:site-specific DNA-methyltransferase (adenine-specific)
VSAFATPADVLAARARWSVTKGDCLDVLRTIPDNSIDAVVTDPPAGIAFMSKEWDDFRRARNPADAGRDSAFGRLSRTSPEYARGSRTKFMAFLSAILRECLRVLKPGAHALVWALPRTSHWTGLAIEDAGFDIRDVIAHHFGSGFPKNHDIAKAIQKASGVEPIGEKPPSLGMANNPQWNALHRQLVMPELEGEAARWRGWGSAMKPSREDWYLSRKPFDGTLAENVLRWGTGGINIAACRVGDDVRAFKSRGIAPGHGNMIGVPFGQSEETTVSGRWPPNTVLSHLEGCHPVGTRDVRTGVAVRRHGKGGQFFGFFGGIAPGRMKLSGPAPDVTYGGVDGREEIEAWACQDGCPVAAIDAQHEGASRFFPTFLYCAKPAVRERELGCEHLPKYGPAAMTGREEGSAGLVMKHDDGTEKANPYAGTSGRARANAHSTVKAVTLMRWLVRLVTPPQPGGGIVLDPFGGSGSTGVAALNEGFRAILCEQDTDGFNYIDVIRARCTHAEGGVYVPGAPPAAPRDPIDIEMTTF